MEYYIPGIISKYCADDVIGETGLSQIATSATDSKIKNINDISYKTLAERTKTKFQILKQSPENAGNEDFFDLLEQTIKNNEKKSSNLETKLEQEHNLEQAILNIERTNMNPNLGATSILASIKKALSTGEEENTDLVLSGNELFYKDKKLNFSYTDGFYTEDNNYYPYKKNGISKDEILDILYDKLKSVQDEIKTTFEDLDEQKQEFTDFIIEGSTLNNHQPDNVKLLKAFKKSYKQDENELKKANEILLQNINFNEDNVTEEDIQNNDFNFYFQSSNNTNKPKPNDNRQFLLNQLKENLGFLERNLHQKYTNAINSFPLEGDKNNKNIVNNLKEEIKTIEGKFKQIKENLDLFEKRKLNPVSIISSNVGELRDLYEERLQKINSLIKNYFPDAPKNSILPPKENPKIRFQKDDLGIEKIEDYYNEFKKKLEENKKLLKEIKDLKLNHQNENTQNFYKIRQLEEQNQWLQNEKQELEDHIRIYANTKANTQQLEQLNQQLKKDNRELELSNETLRQELNELRQVNVVEESKSALGIGIATGTIGVGAGVVGGLGFGEVIALGAGGSTALIAIAAVCLIIAIIAFSIYMEKQNKNEQLTSLINRNKQTQQQKQKYDKQNNNVNNDKPKPLEQSKGQNI